MYKTACSDLAGGPTKLRYATLECFLHCSHIRMNHTVAQTSTARNSKFKRALLMLDIQYTLHIAVPPVLLWMSSLLQGARNNEMTEHPKTFPMRRAAGHINTCRLYLFPICSFSAAKLGSDRPVRHWITAQTGDDLFLGFTAHLISASTRIPVVARLSTTASGKCTHIILPPGV